MRFCKLLVMSLRICPNLLYFQLFIQFSILLLFVGMLLMSLMYYCIIQLRWMIIWRLWRRLVIHDKDVQWLHSRYLHVVKVCLRHRPLKEGTWEIEHEMWEQFPGCLSLQILLDSLLLRKVFFSSEYCNNIHIILSFSHYFLHLKHSYSDLKSFITYCDWQFGHLIDRFSFVKVFVF